MAKRYLVLLLAMMIGLLIGSCTDPAEDDTTAPGAPTTLNYDANQSGDGQIYLLWVAPADKDVSLYRIYRDSGTGTFSEIITVTETFYLDTDLDYNVEYGYKVTAEDDSGNESPFSNTIELQPVNLYSPASPANLTIQAHNIVADFEVNVELTWSANTENDFSYYKIYKSATTPLFVPDEASFLDSVTSIFYLDEDVIPGNTYHYKLVAYDLGHKGSDPTIVVSDTPLEVPSQTLPANLAEGVSLHPTFMWTNVNMAAKYKLVLRTSSQSGDIWEIDITTTSTNTMSVTYPTNATVALSGNTRYYWFVAGFSQLNEEVNVYSATSSFRTL